MNWFTKINQYQKLNCNDYVQTNSCSEINPHMFYGWFLRFLAKTVSNLSLNAKKFLNRIPKLRKKSKNMKKISDKIEVLAAQNVTKYLDFA